MTAFMKNKKGQLEFSYKYSIYLQLNFTFDLSFDAPTIVSFSGGIKVLFQLPLKPERRYILTSMPTTLNRDWVA